MSENRGMPPGYLNVVLNIIRAGRDGHTTEVLVYAGFLAERMRRNGDDADAEQVSQAVSGQERMARLMHACPGCGASEGLLHRDGCPALTAKLEPAGAP